MDIVFKCTNCDQELEVDSSAAGSTIQCPACSFSIAVPDLEPALAVMPAAAPEAGPAAADGQEKHYVVPMHDAPAPAEAAISKAMPPLEVAAREGDKKLRIKTFKRSDCQEVGRDRFDDKVSEFLEKVGHVNIVSINPITYSYIEMGSHAQVNDYGVLIVFKG